METQIEIEQLKNKIKELETMIKSFYSAQTLPFDVVESMRKRLAPVSGDSDSTSPAGYTQAVDESGSDKYNVAKPMAGFITIIINGTSRRVPYY